ncbi:formate dehydrogenase accessory sulfurtransferase FdhD [Chloroflexi bacterium TSY]|nr:formate dehydrogenase accessory sulfurtransferase FdhD [Chloroflexi bacterium TSY]
MSRLSKTRRRILVIEHGKRRHKTDYLATEEPLEIILSTEKDQRTVAITMRTPGNDYELALGFLYSEDIITTKDDVIQISYCVGENRQLQEYNALRVRLNRQELPDLVQLERHFFTNSACGICGSTLIDDLRQRSLPSIPQDFTIPHNVLYEMPDALRNSQNLFESTGGLHAAALFDQKGSLITVREDVGRHNALDKLIGWALMNQKLPLSDKIIMVSGRASYELLQKCIVAGAPLLCAVSAPSSLAVELATEFGITLIGFLRGERFNIYSGHAIAGNR